MEDYICNCEPGFTDFDNTCKDDLCKKLDSSDTYVSQCQNGECIYNKVGNDFYCQCNANFVAHEGGKKCLGKCVICARINWQQLAEAVVQNPTSSTALHLGSIYSNLKGLVHERKEVKQTKPSKGQVFKILFRSLELLSCSLKMIFHSLEFLCFKA